jgi:hypothetical protein
MPQKIGKTNSGRWPIHLPCLQIVSVCMDNFAILVLREKSITFLGKKRIISKKARSQNAKIALKNNQPTNQPTNQPINQSINQPNEQTNKQTNNQSINQWII